MKKITLAQAKAIVGQIADHATTAMLEHQELDTELLASRLIYQLEHPEIIPSHEREK